MSVSERNTEIKLLLVRHGEREDEAEHATHPPQDNLDPLLTRRGHMQARDSFRAISRALPENSRVAVFSSPLRRAIGTSLMLGTVAFDDDKNIQWSSPVGDDSVDPRVIPVTVLNGLGDFAARVNRLGGTDALVPQGLIRCGTMPSNDGSEDSPFVRSLRTMPSHSAGRDRKASRVEFWTPLGARMSRPIDPRCVEYQPETNADKTSELHKQTAYKDALRRTEKVRRQSTLGSPLTQAKPSPPDPIGAVDEAIRITAARGCDTCIIVAHREGIRDLAALCSNVYKLRTPYCCIGSFGATLTARSRVGAASRVTYNFWNVWPFEAFRAHSIPQPLPHCPGSVRLMIFHEGRVSCICHILTSSWEFSLPHEVWLATVQRTKHDFFCVPRDRVHPMEVAILNEHEYSSLTEQYIRPLKAQGLALCFGSNVCYDQAVHGRTRQRLRFRISSKPLPERKVLFWFRAS